MTQKEQVQHFIPAIPVSFSILIDKRPGDRFTRVSSRRIHMPAVPHEGDKLRLLINGKEYDFEVERVVYVEDIPQEESLYEIDLCDVVYDREILKDLDEDSNWS